jgi:ribose-phosphate pyrophosphokinase
MVKQFSDGETAVTLNETVRGVDCYIIQSTCAPVNDNLMEVLILIDAMKRASAGRINVVMPYYGYSRQDRKASARQPISAKLMADLLQTAGANRVICMDLHADQIQGFFDIPIDNFRALPIFAEYFVNKNLKDVVVISPDHGGTTRARRLADAIDAPIAIIDKRRPKPNVAQVMNLIGEVEGKNCVIIDDIVDTAGTLVAAVNVLKQKGAKSVYCCCTHPILSDPAIDRISGSALSEFVTTNTIALDDEMKEKGRIVQLSVAKTIGQGILNIVDDKAVSDLFNYQGHHEK